METNKSACANLMLYATMVLGIVLVVSLIAGRPLWTIGSGLMASPKPAPDAILQALQEGNERYRAGKAIRPNADPARIALAGRESQAKYAYATVLSCSDSRVPVELIFDAGVMDLFVVRVAGNVCDTGQVGSIEYGLAHVHTPVLVVMGHTQCGAVTATCDVVRGRGHRLERNIPPLVESIAPAVKRAMERHADAPGDEIVSYSIEENVYQSIETLFRQSPAVRNLAKSGRVRVIGAVYDVGTGKVDWLDKAGEILSLVEASPEKAVEPYAIN